MRGWGRGGGGEGGAAELTHWPLGEGQEEEEGKGGVAELTY